MKLSFSIILVFAISACGQQQPSPKVEAQTSGECSPNILANQGKVEFTCNTSMDKDTAKKFASLLSELLRRQGNSANTVEEINRKVDRLLAFAKQQSPTIRELTDAQKNGIKEFLKTIPPSVMVTVGSVYGSGDADIYANQFLPLLDGRHYENQTTAAIRTGFPPEFTGVFVATTTDTDSAASYRDAFARRLIELGINAHSSSGSKISSGNLELLIGYRPEEVRRQ